MPYKGESLDTPQNSPLAKETGEIESDAEGRLPTTMSSSSSSTSGYRGGTEIEEYPDVFVIQTFHLFHIILYHQYY